MHFLIVKYHIYQYHKKIMNYSKKIDKILRDELTVLIEKVRNKEYPFDKETTKKYYEEFKRIKKVKV